MSPYPPPISIDPTLSAIPSFFPLQTILLYSQVPNKREGASFFTPPVAYLNPHVY